MSAISPHSKRLRSRSSISASSFGERSLAITICFIDSCSALKVWKNSSCVRSFCARNWMSSISSTSILRNLSRKTGHLVVAQRVDHLVGELLARHVADRRLRHAPLDLVSDGLHQVRLAHANAAIEEQRVVGFRWTLGHGLACRMSKLVAAADHEGIKGVARIQLRRAIPIKPRLRRTAVTGAAAELSPPSCRTGVAAGSSSGVTNFTSLNPSPKTSIAS